ncbi:hypothetical protein [Amycolatopsis sp. cmx-4-54]|uniref:hypothetical protein n=1 Tax=Amycolatopsis sp. cmx-4-54 TaxID=2790936 RepID=UPI00397BC1A3
MAFEQSSLLQSRDDGTSGLVGLPGHAAPINTRRPNARTRSEDGSSTAAGAACRPRKNNRGVADLHTAVRIREDELLDAVGRFPDRFFKPDRTSILEADLTTVDDTAARARADDRERRLSWTRKTSRLQHHPRPRTWPGLRRPLLQTLFEVTQLTAQLNGLGDVVTIGVNLPADQVPAITEAGKG